MMKNPIAGKKRSKLNKNKIKGGDMGELLLLRKCILLLCLHAIQ